MRWHLFWMRVTFRIRLFFKRLATNQEPPRVTYEGDLVRRRRDPRHDAREVLREQSAWLGRQDIDEPEEFYRGKR